MDDWDKNAKYLLHAVEDLSSNQKELINKVDGYHEALLCQKDDCGKRFISKWLFTSYLGILVTVCGAFSYSTVYLYDKISTNTVSIVSNKEGITRWSADIDYIKKNMNLDKYRRTVRTDKGTEIFWYSKDTDKTNTKVTPPTDVNIPVFADIH